MKFFQKIKKVKLIVFILIPCIITIPFGIYFSVYNNIVLIKQLHFVNLVSGYLYVLWLFSINGLLISRYKIAVNKSYFTNINILH